MTLTGLLVAVALAAQAQAARAPVRHDVAVDGHRIAVWEKSRGGQARPALLLIHGRTWSSLPNFDLQVPGERRSMMDALADAGVAVYAMDLRGYGATPRDASGWLTPDRAVADVRAVVDWIRGAPGAGRRPVYVLGFSRGAFVAAMFAQQSPEKITGLVLLAFGLDVDARVGTVTTPPSPPRKGNTIDTALADFITPDAVSRATLDAFVQVALRADPTCADWRDEQQFNAFAPARLSVPTLLVNGELDPSTPIGLQAKLFARIGTPDKAWVVLPGADHAAHLEKALPELVRSITWFVHRHDGPAPPSGS